MSWKDFVSWREYDKIDPLGQERMDYLFASVVATLVNINRNTEKYPNPFPTSDFVLKWGDAAKVATPAPKPQQKTWQQLKLIGQICAATYNMMEESDKKKRRKR